MRYRKELNYTLQKTFKYVKPVRGYEFRLLSSAQKLHRELFMDPGSVCTLSFWILRCKYVCIYLYFHIFSENLTPCPLCLLFLDLELSGMVVQGGAAWEDAQSSEPSVGGRGKKEEWGQRNSQVPLAAECCQFRSHHTGYFRESDD